MTRRRSSPGTDSGATSTTSLDSSKCSSRTDTDADISLAGGASADIARAQDAINRVLAKLDGP